MLCPKCAHQDTKVIDSRLTNSQREIRRRRVCLKCEHRFTTFERNEGVSFTVAKKDSSIVNYDRQKIERGVFRALEKRNISPELVADMIDSLEEKWSRQKKQVTSNTIGEDVMQALLGLDQVAYIRFASVYKDFKDIQSFEQELRSLSS